MLIVVNRFVHDLGMGISWKLWPLEAEGGAAGPVQFEWTWVPDARRVSVMPLSVAVNTAATSGRLLVVNVTNGKTGVVGSQHDRCEPR